MNSSHITRLAAALSGAALALGVVGIAAPAAARADEVIATDTTAVSPAVEAHVPTAVADRPRRITVTNHDGRSVTLFAKGERIRRVLAPGTRPAVFSGLTAGRTYTVAVGGAPIGTVVALDAPSAASGLVVRTTAVPGDVQLTWRHRPTTATGGSMIGYDVVARGGSADPITTAVRGQRSATLHGLADDTLYTFTVVPRNSAGRGRATTAKMTRPFHAAATPASSTEATPTVTVAAVPTPAPVPAPAPAPAPAPVPGPTTKTIYVCPVGYAETAAGACEKTQAYTFTTIPYTFHTEVTGPAPLLDSFGTADVCPGGYNLEDYGWVKYCRRYGPAPTATVKDATPAGYTDTGTAWTIKDPAPTGFTDDGTQWVSVVPKEPRVITV